MRFFVVFILLSAVPGTGKLLVDAIEQYEAGHYNQSVESFLIGLGEHPESSRAIRYNIGQAYFRLDSLDRAVSYFDQVAIGNTNSELSSRAANQAGVIMVRQGQYGKGLEYFRRALVLNEHNEQARWNYELLSKQMLPPPSENPPPGEGENTPDDYTSELTEEALEQILSQLNAGGSGYDNDRGMQIQDTLTQAQAQEVLDRMQEQSVQFIQQLRKKPISSPRTNGKPRW